MVVTQGVIAVFVEVGLVVVVVVASLVVVVVVVLLAKNLVPLLHYKRKRCALIMFTWACVIINTALWRKLINNLLKVVFFAYAGSAHKKYNFVSL